ncbi:probable tyrosyl-tRNA synthetase, mitochondrial precursor [Sporisorium reilianum f. sp. reilianum]|uniref:Tyrosine--tRNA ligase n=1 Tax=Sporisorium reilianum f. sp. reilianum TaxID=72559 RepID=A0A2N8UAX8_9BASI|nr:probable tyrosyl-tRNA synthetase, mitochondrial precursor [Sporisorium reilianum f. sp. reilianum]
MLKSASAARALSCHGSAALHRLWSARRFASTSSSSSTPDLIDELEARGLVATLTSRSLRTHLSAAPRTVYSGVDPSADSLHVGNLLPLLTLAHFARFQHRAIVLVGGATGSIGDPSGRSSERNALDRHTLEGNVEAIKGQLGKFFDNVQEWYGVEPERTAAVGEGVGLGMGVRMLNNHDWMSGVSLLDFLGSVGRHARLTQMLARESVASRLAPSSPSGGAGGMSYTEFSYQLLQAYDFAHLHTAHACTVQLGGSDQLGNITAGIDLIRRTHTLASEPAYGLTLPLLTTHTGDKFGKSAGNAVWLCAAKTSDWSFYQFFLKTTDADVQRYLRCLTLLDVETVEEVVRAHSADPRRRGAQQTLAAHMTRLIRGAHAAERCKALSEVLFSHTSAVDDAVTAAKRALAEVDIAALAAEDLLARVPRADVVGADLTKLVVAAGLVKSRAEAKRLLHSGGLYVNNVQQASGDAVSDEDLVVGGKGGGRLCLLRAGKSAVKVLVVV